MIRTCEKCGTANRVPSKHLADTGRCGSCQAELRPVSTPVDANSDVFQNIIENARVPVLVDFWASWCGPCRMAAPEVAALARDMAGEAIVLKVDTESEQEIASRYRIQSIPHFIVFRNGRPVFQRSGLAPKAEMRRWLQGAATATA